MYNMMMNRPNKRSLTTTTTGRCPEEEKDYSTVQPLPPAKRQKKCLTDMNPVEFIHRVFQGRNFDTNEIIATMDTTFIPPTAERMEAYSQTAIAVRENNLKKLRDLYDSGNGISLDCCNRFGDSLLHIACRRGLTSIVKFLVEEAHVPVNVRDDLLRTPLHDACWTSEPNFEIVDILLRVAPEHALLPDTRGDTPFDYIRQDTSKLWIAFLANRHSLLRPKALTVIAKTA